MAAISGSGSKENVKPKGDSKPIPEGSEKRAQKTKSQMLDIQSSSLATLSEKFTSLSRGQEELLRHRSDLARLEKLKAALALNLLSQEEFDQKAAKLLLDN